VNTSQAPKLLVDDLPAHQSAPAGVRLVGPLALVVADDHAMSEYLWGLLTRQGFRVIGAHTGADALSLAANHNPDVVILESALPDLSAVQVIGSLREWTATPILVLSAHGGEHHKVSVLDAGANDYVTKPFASGELLARIRVWLRSMQRPEDGSETSVLELGELRIDFAKRRAFVRNREVRLTPTLFRLFEVMMRNAGTALSYEQILASVWGPDYAMDTQYVRVHIGKLRQIFEEDAARPRYFVTERGLGYRLCAERCAVARDETRRRRGRVKEA